MSYTKRQIIEKAFAEIGLGAYQYDIQPEDYQSALDDLNGMMAQWGAEGANVGFPISNSPGDDDLDAMSGVGAPFIRGVICGLAAEIATGYGKQPTVKILSTAKAGKMLAQKRSVGKPTRALDYASVPSGAGTKWRDRTTFAHPVNDIVEGTLE